MNYSYNKLLDQMLVVATASKSGKTSEAANALRQVISNPNFESDVSKLERLQKLAFAEMEMEDDDMDDDEESMYDEMDDDEESEFDMDDDDDEESGWKSHSRRTSATASAQAVVRRFKQLR